MQVISSPFDAPQKQRVVLDGVRNRVKKSGSLSIRSFGSRNNQLQSADDQHHGCILFDSRLIKNNDVFANPIITITTEQQRQCKEQKKKQEASARNKLVSTPPPVKGRRHFSCQTDN